VQRGPLFLSRDDIERLLKPDACATAVESAFRQHASGEAVERVVGLHGRDGSFHIKAGLLIGERPYFAAKVNANFPHNGENFGLPTIQGLVILHDGVNGSPLAILDSISITALRTAAATAIAAKYLARKNVESALICGCGAQAAAQARAILGVRNIGRLYVFDEVYERADKFAADYSGELAIPVIPVAELAGALPECEVVITCTTARKFFITREMVRPGTFIAAVGADNEDKQEIDPSLLASSTVVTDITEQACTIGEVHHAIVGNFMTRAAIYAELGEIVTEMKPARTNEDQIIVFDSTGTGLEDVAAALAAYRLACDGNLNVP
jgi:alanine dehydrogenase